MAASIPQLLYDINNNFGQDLSLSARDDLQTVSLLDRSQQRVLRRLLTNPGDYIWHTDYGAGLPAFVGQNLSSDRFDEIKSLITSQIFLEPSVSQTPEPKILLQTIQGGLFVQINYTESATQQPIVLTFDVASTG